jgi:hypothetical protein
VKRIRIFSLFVFVMSRMEAMNCSSLELKDFQFRINRCTSGGHTLTRRRTRRTRRRSMGNRSLVQHIPLSIEKHSTHSLVHREALSPEHSEEELVKYASRNRDPELWMHQIQNEGTSVHSVASDSGTLESS